MLTHQTTYRIIYGDTDNMGVAYHANYFRWFEMGRSEMFRHLGLPYRIIEEKGIFLYIAEVQCRYLKPVRYDELITIETTLDRHVKGGIKFDYTISSHNGEQVNARGFTKHACVDTDGNVIRPPDFIKNLIDEHFSKP